MDFQKAERVFNEYLKDFDINNDKIKLKVVHTYGVIRASEYIARGLKLSNEDIEIAKIIALLHDIGRFVQLKKYNSFDDKIMPHAQCSIDILFKDNMIEKFLNERKFDDIIYKAIKNHGVYKLNEDMQERELLHSKIIRDADKVDNFRVKSVESIATMVDVDEKELGSENITDDIYNEFMKHIPILNENRKTHMDMWVSYFGYIFDFNYSYGLKYILEKDYLKIMFERINYSNEQTNNRMNNIYKESLKYILTRIER